MADPTALPGTLQDIWDDMNSFYDGLIDHNEKARFASYKRYFIKLVMQASIAAVSEAQTFMLLNRKYFKNGGADLIITGNGVEWLFAAGQTYACSPEELTYFLGKCAELGITVVSEADYATWATFAFESYFWS